MKLIPIYIIVFFLIGCTNQPNENSVYIGGEIINPKSNVVLLLQNNRVVDSLYLNEKNFFGANIDLKPGLYYFKHGFEFQYLFLEPKDSIRLRLNTWDFDETLVFEGRGALKNELLLNLFLENEKEKKNFYSYFLLPEKEFNEKYLLVHKRHRDLLQVLTNSNKKLSNEFLHIANAAIDYPLYSIKELYPYYHKKTTKSKKLPKLSPNFYDYRKKIDLNDSILSHFHSYQSFVTTHLYNLTYKQNNAKLYDAKFFKILLNKIISNISNEDFKNKLLTKEIENMFLNDSQFLDTTTLALYYDNCTDAKAVSKIQNILNIKDKLKKNTRLPNFLVLSKDGDSLMINSLIKGKKSVIYFWSSINTSDVYIKKRVDYLQKTFPTINFIGIHIDVSVNKIEKNIQYSLTNNSIANDYVLKQFPRTIILNSKGIIKENFAVLTNWNIENQLTKILQE